MHLVSQSGPCKTILSKGSLHRGSMHTHRTRLYETALGVCISYQRYYHYGMKPIKTILIMVLGGLTP